MSVSRWMALVLLALPYGTAAGQDAHPNDGKVVFFGEPDEAARRELKQAVDDRFNDNAASDRARGRATCYRYRLWSVPFLVRLLDGTDNKSQPLQRSNAVLTLARIADPRGVLVLRDVAERDNSPQARALACLALGMQEGPEPVRILLGILRREKSQVVVVATCLALARLGGSEAENALLSMAKAGASDLERRAALVGLGLFPTASATAEARRALGDKSTDVRWRGILALANGAFDPRAARQAEMQEILGRVGREDGKVRAVALLALARFEGGRGASTLLAQALRDPDPEVVAAAARALQHRGDPRARDAVLEKLRSEMQGDARLVARLLVALADIEARSPTEDGVRFLVSRLEARSSAVRGYAAIALTRVGERAWAVCPDLLRRTLDLMWGALRGGALGDEERGNLRRALSLLDPAGAPEDAPAAWTSPWGDEDEILPSLDETLHDAFLALTNWFFEEEMGLHALTDRPVSQGDPLKGTARVLATENKELRDLKEWLKEAPYFTKDRLPDRGYGP